MTAGAVVVPPEEEGAEPDLLAGLVAELGRSLRLASVAVEAGPLRARWGVPGGETTVVPLRHRGVDVGTLRATPVGDGPDLATLAGLAPLVAAAVVVARSAANVERLRDRLAQVRLEERRVIRAEIHDGLAPALAGIRLGLHGARNLLADHPEAGLELLAHLQGEVDLAVEGVRTLSHHLLPPVLDELGLVPALHELVGRYAGGSPVVDLDAEPVGTLDPRTAAAAYAVVSEALIDLARQPGATRCCVRVRRSSDRLLVEVGVAPGGGTVVRAVLPLVGTSP